MSRIVLAVALACLAPVFPAFAGEQRWNIVSIVTDDQARWAVGAYGNKDVRTPNMDRIAREGARFANAFVNTPVCSPSRASFFTGLHGTRLGITDWINGEEDRAGLGLPATAVTWPRVLQQNGYRTALVGKWHLGSTPQFHPKRHGFDTFTGILGGGASPSNPRLEADGQTTFVQGMIPDLLGDAAVRFLDQSTTSPFALCLHFREPHLPYRPMPKQDAVLFENADVSIPDLKGLDAEQIRNWTRYYYASVHAADRNIGRVLDRLDTLGLTSNTIVLFTSDHGYMIGHHHMHTKGNGSWIAGGVAGPRRPNMFDDSIRVPLLVRCPGQAKPGSVIESSVTNVDIFPTVLALAGVSPPPGNIDGRSFAELFLGEQAPEEKPVFGQYDLHHQGLSYMRMIRTKQWKLVRHYFTDGLDELYDLQKDAGETQNLYGKKEVREVQTQLQNQLADWQRSIDDPIVKRLPPTALAPHPIEE